MRNSSRGFNTGDFILFHSHGGPAPSILLCLSQLTLTLPVCSLQFPGLQGLMWEAGQHGN